MDAGIVLLAQIFALGDAVADGIAADVAHQINGAGRQLLWPQLFRRHVDGVAHPVYDLQALIQLLTRGFRQFGPFDVAFPFRPAVTLPKRPAVFQVPTVAGEFDILMP